MCTEYEGKQLKVKFHYSFVEKKLPYKLVMRRQVSEDKKTNYKSFPVIAGGMTKLLKTTCEIIKVGENGETELISVGETIQGTYRDKETKELKVDNLNYAYARIQSFWYALTDIPDLSLAFKLLYSFFHDFNKSKAGKRNNDAIYLMDEMLDEFEALKKLNDKKDIRTEA